MIIFAYSSPVDAIHSTLTCTTGGVQFQSRNSCTSWYVLFNLTDHRVQSIHASHRNTNRITNKRLSTGTTTCDKESAPSPRTQDPDPITPYTTKESPISLKPNSPKKRKKKKEHINGRKTALSETLLSSAQQQEEWCPVWVPLWRVVGKSKCNLPYTCKHSCGIERPIPRELSSCTRKQKGCFYYSSHNRNAIKLTGWIVQENVTLIHTFVSVT